MSKELQFAYAMQPIMKTLNRHDIRDEDEGNLAFAAFELGEHFERLRIIELLEESDSVCNEWAIAIIKGETK